MSKSGKDDQKGGIRQKKEAVTIYNQSYYKVLVPGEHSCNVFCL
jgi:hypothetical protein